MVLVRCTKWLECWSRWPGCTRRYTSGPTAQVKMYKVVCVLVTVARTYKELLWLPGSLGAPLVVSSSSGSGDGSEMSSGKYREGKNPSS